MKPYELGIVEALSAMADGRLTRREYLDSCIARTEAIDPSIRAFAHFDPGAVRSSDDVTGPLAGIPVGLKDIIRTKGVQTEMGSPAFRGHVPDRSASVVDALSAAGAVLFGKTVTTEFAWRQPGATRNPWNPAHTPGGSSSGSVAAVSYGAVPAALGTQTLGSVLRPAAFCGVVGFKPSYSAIPRTGVYPFAASLDHVGVFARSVGDAALLASVLVGNDGIDFPNRMPLVPAWPLRAASSPPRIGLLRTSAWSRVSAEQQALVESIAARIAGAGATVTSIELPPVFDGLWAAATTLCDVEGGAVNAPFADETPTRISRHTIDLVARGRATTAFDYVAAKDLQQTLSSAFSTIAAPFDAILTTPALGCAPRGLDDTGDAVFCTPATLFGAPAITIPAGLGAEGLPLGIQLIGAWNDDRRLLETAAWVEDVIDWRPGFPPM